MLHALENEYEERKREGIHYSELIYCPREALLRRIDPKPLTTREMMFFFIGECVHRGIEYLLKKHYPKDVETEKQVRYKGLIGTMDSVVNEMVCEYKTSWSTKPTLKQHYRDQCEGYMAMANTNDGLVMIVMLMWILKGQTPFQIHNLHMTEGDREKRLKWIEDETKAYKIALDKKDWHIARHVIGSEMRWKCESCRYRSMCWTHEGYKVKQTFAKGKWKEEYYKE